MTSGGGGGDVAVVAAAAVVSLSVAAPSTHAEESAVAGLLRNEKQPHYTRIMS